ncbi:tetratricopeptide repeat protein [Sphingomonas sp. LT1P40]|uniref:tetratricopeptide repeat protein n=1 Tax=Alteristakelama amylovorans TaxID=3096166 RepID=UPI002FC67113
MMPQTALADARAYVRARAAAADGEVGVAAAGYAVVMATAPDDEVVAIRAYRNALAAGDLVLAKRAAGVLTRSGVAPPDVSILMFADALRSRDRTAADDAVGRIGAGPLDFLTPILRAWLAYDRGEDPFAPLDASTESALSRRYIAEHRALLLIASNRTDEGVSALHVAVSADPGSVDLRWNAATLLAAKGKRNIGLSLLSGDDPVMTGLRERLKRGPKPGAAFGVSRTLTRLASDLAEQETQSLSILLARSALLLDPADDRARLLLAAALAGEQAYDRASAVLDGVTKESPFYAAALGERIDLRRKQGDPAGALTLAATLAGSPDATVADRQRYADMLDTAGREAEAAKVYADALTQAGAGASWVNYLQLGGALERAGQWDAALPHLLKAVELAPEQPVALNYLGYAQVERGENLDAAQALLERASALRPDDAAITDSLAWAYFRRGDVARALPLLEKAAQGEPGSATINEHLGDAYWRAGRRYEARYAWRAAALYAEGEQKTRLSGKLADGLAQRVAAN